MIKVTMIKTFSDFKNYYIKYGKCINQMAKPNHKMTDNELQVKFDKFIKNTTKIIKVDEKWLEVKRIVIARDNSCRLLKKLYLERKQDYYYIINHAPKNLLNILDGAHVISRTESKNLYYEPDNIILLSRYVHSMLDTYHDPVTGEDITAETRSNWFRYIIGNELYNDLLRRK